VEEPKEVEVPDSPEIVISAEEIDEKLPSMKGSTLRKALPSFSNKQVGKLSAPQLDDCLADLAEKQLLAALPNMTERQLRRLGGTQLDAAIPFLKGQQLRQALPSFTKRQSSKLSQEQLDIVMEVLEAEQLAGAIAGPNMSAEQLEKIDIEKLVDVAPHLDETELEGLKPRLSEQKFGRMSNPGQH